jgi:hypothetical protein
VVFSLGLRLAGKHSISQIFRKKTTNIAHKNNIFKPATGIFNITARFAKVKLCPPYESFGDDKAESTCITWAASP